MATVGVVGLGDMGSGLAKNLIAAGFETRGFDLSEKRMADFGALGGIAVRRHTTARHALGAGLAAAGAALLAGTI